MREFIPLSAVREKGISRIHSRPKASAKRKGYMAKTIHSLQSKLTASFLALIVLISALTFFLTFSETKKALKAMIKSQIMSVAAVTATQIDGDAFAAIKEGDEATPAFLQIRDLLYKVEKASPDIRYAYTYRRHDDSLVEFVVDGEYGISEDAAAAGEVYDETTPAMIEGLGAPAADPDFSTDEWGTFLSGFAPIRNSKNEVVGAVGIDMLSAIVIEKQRFISGTVYAVFGVAVVGAGAIVAIFSVTIIRDIKRLNKAAEAISKGQLDVSIDVVRKDEIGDLADSFSRMVSAIKIITDGGKPGAR